MIMTTSKYEKKGPNQVVNQARNKFLNAGDHWSVNIYT